MRYSATWIGEKFEHKGQIWTRFTYNRGRAYIDGKLVVKRFKKHAQVKLVEEREK